MLNEKQLIELGYTRNEWFDHNDPKDTFNTLRFISYEKPISYGFKISICFGYFAESENDWKRLEVTAELECADKNLPLPKDIEKIEQVYNILKQTNE